MAGAVQLTECDYDQIRTNLIEYLKSTKQFTDFSFEGSNLSVILNLISYSSQMNSYATNMLAAESFLASSSIRSNTVLNARMLGYLPTSERSAVASLDLEFQLNINDYPNNKFPQYLEIRPGMCFLSNSGRENLTFNVVDTQIAGVDGSGRCEFRSLQTYEGLYTKMTFVVDETNYNQKFIIENQFIDTTTIRIEVQEDPNLELNAFYEQANNLVELNPTSRAYWIQEVSGGYYELVFGDGLFGKKLRNGAKIFVNYLISNGELGNGVQGSPNFHFVGQIYDSFGTRLRNLPEILNEPVSEGGSTLESVSSVKFRATKYYGAQQRCVVPSDYDALVRQIYPAVEDIYVFGGETLPIPEYGRVYIIIKPISGDSLSNTTKNFIKDSLSNYRIASLDIRIQDPVILYVECDSVVYYDDRRTNKDSSSIIAIVRSTLLDYANSSSVSKFGGVVRYSRIVGAIDDSDVSITRNNTTLRIRRDIKILKNTSASYEICFNNEISSDATAGVAVWSSGFKIQKNGIVDSTTYYFEDDGKGVIYSYYYNSLGVKLIDNANFGTVDYVRGEVLLGYQTPIVFVDTIIPNDVIEIRVRPKSQDIIATHKLYLSMDIAKSEIEASIDRNISGS